MVIFLTTGSTFPEYVAAFMRIPPILAVIMDCA
jgi:hypothetical protein